MVRNPQSKDCRDILFKVEILRVFEMILYFGIKSNDCHCQCQMSGEDVSIWAGKDWGEKKVYVRFLSHYLFASKMSKMRAAQTLFLTIKSFI